MKPTLPLIVLLTTLWSPLAAAQTATTAPSTAPQAPAASTAPAREPLIDINTASKDELQTLTGIGPARADGIVKGRPYKGKDELHRKGIIPQGVYEGIKDRIVARQG